MLLGSYWTGRQEDEDLVSVAEEALVSAHLRAGTHVVVDATHLHPPFLRKWARLATRLGVDFEVVDVIEDLDECKRRDHARMLAGGRYVGDSVIDRQARRWPVEKWPKVTAQPFTVEPAHFRMGLPDAIICDIDGTLAHIPAGGRSPYDYSRVSEDQSDAAILSILDAIEEANDWWRLIIVSGRDDTCREQTEKWLADNCVWFDELLMRDANAVDERGGKLPDYIVKYDIFNKHIRDKYNVHFVLDDRTQVVEMWRKLGLKCLQVAPGDF